MNKFNAFIQKINFKKIAIWYLILAVIVGIACLAMLGVTYRDKINFAIKYAKISERFEKENGIDVQNAKQSLNELAKSSKDIKDILILDNKNNILYSTNNTNLAWEDSLNLTRNENESKFLVSRDNADIAFKYAKKDDFMLSSVFAKDFSSLHEEYDEDSFYKFDYQNKKVYLLGFLGGDKSGNKVYVINSTTEVKNGMLMLKATATLATLFFMLYWLLCALWVYQNARKSKLSAPLWGIIVLFTNIPGILVYVLYKHLNILCEHCGSVQSKDNLFCTSCGKKIGTVCDVCGVSVRKTDNFCPKCGNKLK